MAKLTKAGIIDAVHAASGLSKKESGEIVEAFVGAVKDALAAGETVKLGGFGTFAVRDKSERQGRDPQTGEAIRIAARRVVSFRASDLLKQKLSADIADGGHDF